MIELQLLNYILEKKSFSILKQNGISQDFFVTYANEANFIYAHYEKYKTIPDKETFLSEFSDFDLFLVTESEEYLVDTIKEQHLYNLLVPVVNNISNLTTEDSGKAVQYAKQQLEKLGSLAVRHKPGFDLKVNAMERGKEYELRLKMEGLMGITTGIEEFDQMTKGWLKGEELVIIVGRTNEGKTWVLLFFLVAAWLSGKKVLLYSGEMSKDIVGFRIDTLAEHFSHSGLTSGAEDLGEGKTSADYLNYLRELQESDKPSFIVVTQKDFGGKKPTVSEIDSLVELHKPDIVGIDQISLMEDERAERGTQERIRYTHISEDLYIMSENRKVPVLSPSQANRDSAKKKQDDGDEDTPDLHEISESDGIGQNATRVIGMRQLGKTLKLSLRKSRYSAKGGEILMLWDIDRGLLKPFMQVNKDEKDNVTSTEPIEKGNALTGEELF